ncbi:ribosomal protein L7/L12 [Paenibacillus rhizoplanae]
MEHMDTIDLIAILALVLALLLMLSVFSLKKACERARVPISAKRCLRRNVLSPASSRAADIPAPLFVQNPELAPDLERRIRLLMAEGKKIQAIKVMREARNLGLKEAKDFVDNLEQGGNFR